MTADGHGEIPGTGQPVRPLTHGLADAEPVVQNHHAWPRATTAGARQIAGHPAPGRAGAYARTGQATGVTRLCTCAPTGCGVRTR